ncbi:hypothetical protein Acife_2839 [Acidithiobacillus ferrivorans SS3]|uniref:Lipoprotein SmpA/OmlA domain-containing protein n=2 Tax=Acidithiobacillus ferrivorans TaxID=160808 RepID=G0JSK6_9PROT|nr:hypothetical protein Acife_2839 [Acidithiobacillus ferrivorans SS3]
MKPSINIARLLSITCLASGLIGCATQEYPPATTTPASGALAAAPTASTTAVPPITNVLPAPGTPFSKLKIGMSRRQVEQLIGFPDHTSSHITGKQFIPFYFGGDTRRTEASYKGQGVLTYDNNSQFGSTDTLLIITVDANTP